MNRRFNIRVYGICLQDGRVLVNEELIRGQKIIKFPGGGLDWGEGTLECLKREWLEELGLEIEVTGHFYTTDFFQASAYDDSQIISIYYLVSIPDPVVIKNLLPNESTYWMNISDITESTFTLPIDKIAGKMILDNAKTQ
jgi:ADP-ribose pyrophosphatase YjhB (NUDIX family)